MDVALVRMAYTGERNAPLRSRGPEHAAGGGLAELLREAGAARVVDDDVHLAPEEAACGDWHRAGLACGRLADAVAAHAAEGRFVVGLLGSCTALLGMLAGLGRADKRPCAMLFIDAHGDFNTPETTPSGMLGGMPVAAAAGLCLHRLRRAAGLAVPLPAPRIVMAGLRDVDPEEEALLDEHGIERIPVEDLRAGGAQLRGAAARLAAGGAAIYVHVDLDVLDPAEVDGHPLAVPGGPSSGELAAALEAVFSVPAAAALGVASTPPADRDPDAAARRAAHRLIAAAVTGRARWRAAP